MTHTIKISNVLGHVNQFEYRDGEKAIFQSYNSVCCIIDYKHSTITFGRDWDYSRTTMKHLLEFLRRFGNQTSKTIRKAIDCGELGYFKVIYDGELA